MRTFTDVAAIDLKAASGLISALVGGLSNYVDDIDALRAELRDWIEDDEAWAVIKQTRISIQGRRRQTRRK